MFSNNIRSGWRRALAAAALSLLGACGGGGGGPIAIESMTVFGDSLSDVGTYQVTTVNPANPGKFTVNPGNIWVDNIAGYYGQTLKPNRSLTMDKTASYGATTQIGTATVLGGNGYAEGGARVSQYPSQSGVGNNQLVAPVAQQVTNYLSVHSSFGAKELVVIGGGANDTYAQFDALCWGGDDNNIGAGNTTLAIATAAVAQAANDLVAQVKRIRSKGANAILVYGAGDWSSNPFGAYYLSDAYQASGCYTSVPAAQITGWTTSFNNTVRSALSTMSGVVFLDINQPLGAAAANPSSYGLVNVTEPACNNTVPSTSAVFCTTATMVAPNADQTYLYSDSFHPSPRGHKILSNSALSLLGTVAVARN